VVNNPSKPIYSKKRHLGLRLSLGDTGWSV
jgi:hypothetical protein